MAAGLRTFIDRSVRATYATKGSSGANFGTALLYDVRNLYFSMALVWRMANKCLYMLAVGLCVCGLYATISIVWCAPLVLLPWRKLLAGYGCVRNSSQGD